jgi:hypothetical protein
MWIMTSAVANPKICGTLTGGLGRMGWIRRRKKQNAA